MSNASNLSKLGNSPAFSAYHSSTQTLTGGVTTKLNYATKEYDTNTCYDTSTSKFTPNQSGYYKIDAAIQASGTNGAYLYVYKNGSPYKLGAFVGANGSGQVASVSVSVPMNGTTDYIEIYANFGTTQATTASAASGYFQGFLVRGI